MEPTLLVGDRIFVSKYTYGYSKHSFPFSPNFSDKRFFSKIPERGDLVVFKTPADNRTDYIKRLIGMPGDTIQFTNGNLLINGSIIPRDEVASTKLIRCGKFKLETKSFIETLPNGIKYTAVYKSRGTLQNTKKFTLDYFKKYSLNVKVLKADKAPMDFILLKNDLISETERLLSHIEIGLNLIKDWRLRKETFIILNIAKRLCFLLKQDDPLLKKIKLSRIDLIVCFIKGIVLN